ncbi:MAG: UDP-N-acetylmuramate dehydrogenase [Bacteroidales bacterium]
MLNVEELVSLKSYNTFGVDVRADYLITLSNEEDVRRLFRENYLRSNRFFILGGGSNVLFVGNYRGIILHPRMLGIEVISEDENYVVVKVAAGEDWDGFVAYAVQQGWGGIENLSGIPGLVGSAPIQNIGAYGVEVKDTLLAVEGFLLDSQENFRLNNFDCEFGYRTSIFKTRLAGRCLITAVVFRLSRRNHLYNLSYQGLSKTVASYGEVNLNNIRRAVLQTREAKLPDPLKIGNAGSFFKNPVVGQGKAFLLRTEYPQMPVYEFEKGKYKLSAAWLIEQCGWKGYRQNEVGVYEKQPLVLVNYGSARGEEILELATSIQQSVKQKFDIELEMEVNVVV